MPAVTANLNRVMQNVQVALPGALTTASQLELFNVLNEFFQDSNIWTEDLVVSVLGDGVTKSYALTTASGGVINRLLQVVDPNGNTVNDVSMQTPGTLLLTNTRTTAVTYTATVALTVTDPVDGNNNPTCPDWIIGKYGTEIQCGVIGRMMTQPAKPYTNERLGILNTRKFRGGVAQAKYEVLHKNVFRAQGWRFPKGFSVRRQGGTSILPPQ